jgi:hypothetical protein
VERQVAIIWAGTNGYLDDVPTPKIKEFETGLYRFLDQNHPSLLPGIASEKSISDSATDILKEALTSYRSDAGYGSTDAAESAEAPAEEPASGDDHDAEPDPADATPAAEAPAAEASAAEAPVSVDPWPEKQDDDAPAAPKEDPTA